MRALVTAQPFASVQMDEFYIEKTSRTHGHLYGGWQPSEAHQACRCCAEGCRRRAGATV